VVITLRVAIILGTRPEIVKMAPVVHECERRGIDLFLLHTGQHFSDDMSRSFFRDLDLRDPDKNLHIGSGTHAEQTAKAMIGVEKELVNYKPDVVLVEGDTNAVLSAAIAAVKLNIPVGHVEAGLRSYDYRMPEEHNRRLTDHASSFLFAPTATSANTLRREHVWGKVFITGNTVIDALEELVEKAGSRALAMDLPDQYVLLTLHRAENVDDPQVLSGILKGILSIGKSIVFPAHPRTLERLKQFGLLDVITSSPLMNLMDPVGYLDFIGLIARAEYILTDSGGIQEEITAPSINKRAFVLRTSTERPEAVESGHVVVVGVDPQRFPGIIESEEKIMHEKSKSPYGDGDAAKKIVEILINELPSR
jgi:UDP-N-acetylglucosamine 2-epimerase (non-hydrolysing)